VGAIVGVTCVGAWLFTVIDTTESAVPPTPSPHLTVQLAVPKKFKAGVIVRDVVTAQSTSEVFSASIVKKPGAPPPSTLHSPPGASFKLASQTVAPEFEFTAEQVGAVDQVG
jgi:hypothetical protein